MVTTPNKQSIPPAPTGLVPAPTKIEPPTMVSGNASTNVPGSNKDIANKDRSGENKFKMPDSVSPREIQEQSFRYGGGRSAGNRSLAANKAIKENQP